MIKIIPFIVLIIIPLSTFAQLETDGKTEVKSVITPDNNTSSSNLLISSATNAPFGLKYLYCKNWGGYVSFKTDFGIIGNFNLLTAGISKSIGKKADFYFGAGLNLAGSNSADSINVRRENIDFTLESGIIIKYKKMSFDLGVGTTFIGSGRRTSWGYYSIPGSAICLSLILGIGFNF
jgi:hypothetical protein